MGEKAKKYWNPIFLICVIVLCCTVSLVVLLGEGWQAVGTTNNPEAKNEAAGFTDVPAAYLSVPSVKEQIADMQATFLTIGGEGVLIRPDGGYETIRDNWYPELGINDYGLLPESEQADLLRGQVSYPGYFSFFDQPEYFGVTLPESFDPSPREVKKGDVQNPKYVQAVKEYLKTEYQIIDLPIVIQEVYEADLDGDGKTEAVITAENIPKKDFQDPIGIDTGKDATDTSAIPLGSLKGHYRLILLWQPNGKTQEIYYDLRPLTRYVDGQLIYEFDLECLFDHGFGPIDTIYLYDASGRAEEVVMRAVYESYDYSTMDTYDRILGIWDLDNDGKIEVVFAWHNYVQAYYIFNLADGNLQIKCRVFFLNP